MTVTNADDFYVEDKKDGRHAGESDKKEWVFLEDIFLIWTRRTITISLW